MLNENPLLDTVCRQAINQNAVSLSQMQSHSFLAHSQHLWDYVAGIHEAILIFITTEIFIWSQCFWKEWERVLWSNYFLQIFSSVLSQSQSNPNLIGVLTSKSWSQSHHDNEDCCSPCKSFLVGIRWDQQIFTHWNARSQTNMKNILDISLSFLHFSLCS